MARSGACPRTFPLNIGKLKARTPPLLSWPNPRSCATFWNRPLTWPADARPYCCGASPAWARNGWPPAFTPPAPGRDMPLVVCIAGRAPRAAGSRIVRLPERGLPRRGADPERFVRAGPHGHPVSGRCGRPWSRSPGRSAAPLARARSPASGRVGTGDGRRARHRGVRRSPGRPGGPGDFSPELFARLNVCALLIPPCANDGKTSSPWRNTPFSATPNGTARPSSVFPTRPWSCCRAITGPATCPN